MSTRRRKKGEATEGSGDTKQQERDMKDKPLPPVEEGQSLLREIRGREGIKGEVVSTITEMTSEVSRGDLLDE